VPVTDRASDYQSLYRRFRPQRFDEVLGQGHVSLALRNAVRQDTVAHAYLFSGPRGTGKTSTARILAKALNCAAPHDGEPCGVCESCVDIARGTSLDVHELDAASNNGVDAMRDLVARAALGTPGRWKVYIVDEVHMLSTQASNALLKTLEEPPGHVVFVLATTDAQKVLPTVRSRTQHFEFRLLGPETLSELVAKVSDAAQLPLGEDARAAAVRRGRGSARDALSALDQLAAAGVVDDEVPVLAELGQALAERDPARALVAVAQATSAGRDIHTLTAALVDHLRQGFLFMVAPELVTVPASDRPALEAMARAMGLPAVVRAMETLGRAQVDMRDAPDQRVNLEAALIRLAHPEADDSPAALLERLERLERALAGAGAGGAASAEAPPADRRGGGGSGAGRPSAPGPSSGSGGKDAGPGSRPPAPPAAEPAGEPATGGPDLARQTLGAIRRQRRQGAAGTESGAPAPSGTAPASPATSTNEPAVPSRGGGGPGPEPRHTGAPGAMPSRDELVQVWGDGLLTQLSARARARFRVGRFIAVDDAAVFALPNETHRSYCEEVRLEVEQALAGHFGTGVPLRLVVDEEAEATSGGRRAPAGAPPDSPGGAGSGSSARPRRSRGGGEPGAEPGASAGSVAFDEPAPADEEEALLDPVVLAAETEPAGAALSPEQRLKQMFPGAEEL
jgi:DNA polymerase-3 subunit gamma/tau